jgi:NAD(P)-dependent dehydrogenase (short-subunit alcohol dehydrogenase family)
MLVGTALDELARTDRQTALILMCVGGGQGSATILSRVRPLRSEKEEKESFVMSKLAGKIALVTGGSTGIGLATAQRFVAEGARVFITGRRQNELDAAVKQIGKDAIGVQGDVSKLGDLDRLFAAIEKQKGHLDIVFANAGIAEQAPFGSITEESFDRQLAINVKGVFFTVQKALPLLREGASIVLNASIVASKGLPDVSVYSATKAALRSFARTWTTDLKGRNIRVNVVSPGPIHTPGLEGLHHAGGAQLEAAYADKVPLGRVGQPDEIARAVTFLASSDSSFITGIELFVDGGMAQV